jgi:hypothetical protein
MDNLVEKSFAGLTSAFNTTFEMEEKDVKSLFNQTEKSVELLEEKKNELFNNKKELSLKDESFLEEELKTLIINTRTMLTKLETEIKIGSKSGYWDSYARLAMTVTNQLKELRELNVAVVETEISKRNSGNIINSNKRATIMLDANSLMEYIMNVKNNSEINKIDATFTIDEEDK